MAQTPPGNSFLAQVKSLASSARAALPSPFTKTTIFGGGIVPQRPEPSYEPNRLPSIPVWQNNWPIFSDWNVDTAIRSGMKASTIVYACVMRRAFAMASVPWIVERMTPTGQWERAMKPNGEPHDLETLIENPNPAYTRYQFMLLSSIWLDLAGNATHQKIIVDRTIPPPGQNADPWSGIPYELWPVNPSFIKPMPSHPNWEHGYRYMMGGILKDIPPWEMLHMQLPDPENPYWGLAPLKALAMTVDTDREAVEWNKVSLKNRAVSEVAIIPKEHLDQEQWQDARDQVAQMHMGAHNARVPWVLSGDADIKNLTMTPAEMDFLNSREFAREEICIGYGTPLPLLTGEQRRASMGGQSVPDLERIWWLSTIVPNLLLVGQFFNKSLVPHWDENARKRRAPRLRVVPDLSSTPAMLGYLKEKTDILVKLCTVGVPLNRGIDLLRINLPHIEGGDVAMPLRATAPSLLTAGGENPNPEDAVAPPKFPGGVDPDAGTNPTGKY